MGSQREKSPRPDQGRARIGTGMVWKGVVHPLPWVGEFEGAGLALPPHGESIERGRSPPSGPKVRDWLAGRRLPPRCASNAPSAARVIARADLADLGSTPGNIAKSALFSGSAPSSARHPYRRGEFAGIAKGLIHLRGDHPT